LPFFQFMVSLDGGKKRRSLCHGPGIIPFPAHVNIIRSRSQLGLAEKSDYKHWRTKLSSTSWLELWLVVKLPPDITPFIGLDYDR